MNFKFGFAPRESSGVKVSSETRPTRKSEWLKKCVQVDLGDSFPDGGVVEGGIFIRNDEPEPEPVPMEGVVHTSPVIVATMEIKKPASKRLQNWLTYFYPLSPHKTAAVPTVPHVSPPASTTSSDIEIDPILHRFSPPPKKSILKKKHVQVRPHDLAKEVDLLKPEFDLMGCGHQKTLVFKETTYIVETYSREEYNRSAIDYIARALTPAIAALIKKELNEVKSEMEVHEESKKHTQFYSVH